MSLPATPSLSCCRIILDHNPRLHHLPYLLGCQQTILEYSNHAAWAAFPLAQNTMDGVWNLKLSGCDQPGEEEEDEEDEVPVIVTQSGKRLRFSDKLKCIWNTAEINVCSLKELCLKQVYSLVVGRIAMRQSGALSLVGIAEIVLSLVEIFIERRIQSPLLGALERKIPPTRGILLAPRWFFMA